MTKQKDKKNNKNIHKINELYKMKIYEQNQCEKIELLKNQL